ncbi:cytochrome-c peroxidase [Neisseria sp. Ec49-e6-T10]|uniref:cytochrome-c peroxidase n=1 Tax=Neisseria sp. Ec49-e6-T10 TaxID=3140744 RepID=UPI003EBCAA71
MNPRKNFKILSILALGLLSFPVAQANTPDTQALMEQAQALFKPLPKVAENKANPLNDYKIELGQRLFYEPRLSKGHTVSCNSCHNLASYGVDNLPTSQGHKGQFGARNSPTVLNAALLGFQFWDGRAKDVEEQAGGPILNPVEMALPHKNIAIDTIASIPEYQDLFKKAFPKDKNPVSMENIQFAIGAFERTLLTPTRWDNFLNGDANALSKQELIGLDKFISTGCIACHQGYNLGGDQFQKFGLVKEPYWQFTGSKVYDEGRFEVTKVVDDKYIFRVPGLRNVVRTYPYFHDGSVWSLNDAVAIMGEAQLGHQFSKEDVADIVAFFGTLTGDVPEKARTMPILPMSTDKTPKPNN